MRLLIGFVVGACAVTYFTRPEREAKRKELLETLTGKKEK